jgi:N-acetylmuramoyl-L-alanine amidase
MRIAAPSFPSNQRRWAWLAAGLLAVVCFASRAQGQAGTHSQYVSAQKLQAALEEKPESQRTLHEYQAAVQAYRNVYFTTPGAQDATHALLAIGGLYREMGHRFDKKYFHPAIVTYDFLLRQYPESQLRSEAAWAIARIEQQDLHARKDAQAAYREFLNEFPDSPQAGEARAALASLQTGRGMETDSDAAIASAGKPVASRNAPDARRDVSSVLESTETNDAGDDAENPPQRQSKPTVPNAVSIRANPEYSTEPVDDTLAHVNGVQASQGVGHTRIVLSLDHSVKFESGRAHNPERIFFDIAGARAAHSLLEAPIAVNDGRVKAMRLGQHGPDVVRLVLDVEGGGDFSSMLLHDPERLVIDIQGGGTAAKHLPSVTEPAELDAAAMPPNTPVTKNTRNKMPSRVASDSVAADDTATPPSTPLLKTSRNKVSARASANPDEDEPSISTPSGGWTSFSRADTVAQPMRNGQRSLTRELGLKINRIVIDAGHGGHDTGTIGPNGLMEKEVCLDVALRLGKLIQRRMPGAEVIYTRKDDTFIPLEERTAIANREKADLFISIHANSSPNSSARGVETYYLNFATSPDAMQVATRENATSQSSVHELQSLIQKIARNEKVDESREFAVDMQESLSKRLETTNPAIADRGVKRAPFVVLIGANMPSILAEISFLSNPTDEHLLRGTAERQRVAEGLLKGVENYLTSLNSLAVNSTPDSPVDAGGPHPDRNHKQASRIQ